MSHQEQQKIALVQEGTFINIRKLAALDIVFHGTRLILIEFALSVVLCSIFAIFSFFSFFRNPSHPFFIIAIAIVLSWIALNYIPMLLYAIRITRQKSAQQEVAFELEHKDFYAPRYTVQSLLLTLPLIIPILAIIQEVQKRRVVPDK